MFEYTNKEIASLIEELADLMEIRGDNQYKIRAYTNAAHRIMESDRDLQELYQEENLQEIKGIGSGIAETISELFREGKSSQLEELKTELPPGVLELLELPGLGPARAHSLYYELEINNIDDLQQAIKEQRVRNLSGFGPKLEAKLQESLDRYRRYEGQFKISTALQCVSTMCDELKEKLPDLEIISPAGDVRRKKELIEEIELVASVADKEGITESLRQISFLKEIKKTEGTSPEVIQSLTAEGLKLKLILVDKDQHPAALRYYTGSAEHNSRLKKFVQNNYEKPESEEKMALLEKGYRGAKQEQSIFEKLNLQYIIPELRENKGEVEAAAQNELPDSVEGKDIKGDLHVHSRYSDGAFSLEDMVQAAQKLGYRYLGFTDHSQSLKVAHGLSPDRLKQQSEEIIKLQEKHPGIKILRGTEVDILEDGSLDYEDRILEELDYVIASIHSGFNQDREKITGRLKKAASHPLVDIIGHPQGRLLGKRSAYQVDIKEVITAAGAHDTAVEINASPFRLDLDDQTARYAAQHSVKIVINTDAHHIEELSDMELGVGVARRGWLEAEDILNTRNYNDLISFFRGE